MNLDLNGTLYYSAPKNAGTTIRYWMNQYDGHLQDVAGQEYVSLKRIPRLWRDHDLDAGFQPDPRPDVLRWCIVRDPVERFVSAFNDKVLRERRMRTSVSRVVDGVIAFLAGDRPRLTDFMLVHFVPQTYWLGSDPAYFDHIFGVNDMAAVKQFCEDSVFRMPLRDVHMRNASHATTRRLRLSKRQRRRVEQLYEADYESGLLTALNGV